MNSRRFILSAAQMSEGFAAAKCIPARADFFDGLPAASGILPDVLAGPDGELDPFARLTFEIIAKPNFSLRLLNFADGSGLGIETRLVSDDEEAYVALARPDQGHWDVAFLGERELALALLDELLGASDSTDQGENFSIALSMPQLAIIAAIAQLARLEELRARLEGKAAAAEFFFAPIQMQQVEAAIVAEKDKPDLGSPLSRLAMMCRGAVFDALIADGLQQGFGALIRDGLADADGRLRSDGLALVALLMSRDMLTLLQSARKQAGSVVVDSLLMLHGPGSLLVGTWRMNAEGRAEELIFRAMGGSELLEFLDLMLGPLVLREDQSAPDTETRICLACGTLYQEAPKYCRECGVSLPD